MCLSIDLLFLFFFFVVVVVAVLAVLLMFWPLSYMYVVNVILSSRNDLEDPSLARLYRFLAQVQVESHTGTESFD